MKAMFVLFSAIMLIFLSGCSIGVNACVEDDYCSTRELQSTSICNDCIDGPFIPEAIAGMNHYSQPDIESQYTAQLANDIAGGYIGVTNPLYVLYAHSITDVLDQYAEKTSVLLAKHTNKDDALEVIEYLINTKYDRFDWTIKSINGNSYYSASGSGANLREDLSIFTDEYNVYFLISDNNDAHDTILERYLDKYATDLVDCNLVNGACGDADIMEFCNDSDGFDIYVKGNTYTLAENKTDVCINSTNVYEYSCVDNTLIKSGAIPCQNRCADGACVGEEYSIGLLTAAETSANSYPINITTDNFNIRGSASGTTGHNITLLIPSECLIDGKQKLEITKFFDYRAHSFIFRNISCSDGTHVFTALQYNATDLVANRTTMVSVVKDLIFEAKNTANQIDMTVKDHYGELITVPLFSLTTDGVQFDENIATGSLTLMATMIEEDEIFFLNNRDSPTRNKTTTILKLVSTFMDNTTFYATFEELGTGQVLTLSDGEYLYDTGIHVTHIDEHSVKFNTVVNRWPHQIREGLFGLNPQLSKNGNLVSFSLGELSTNESFVSDSANYFVSFGVFEELGLLYFNLSGHTGYFLDNNYGRYSMPQYDSNYFVRTYPGETMLVESVSNKFVRVYSLDKGDDEA